MPNPGVSTLSIIRTAAADRADQPTPTTTTFITTATWLTYINSSYFELYNLLVQKYGENYFTALDANNNSYQFTTTGTSDMYALPDGSSTYKMPDGTTAPAFFKLSGVDLWISAAVTTPPQWFTLHRFTEGERNRWTVPGALAPSGYIGLRYRLEGNKLWLRPFPQANQLLQVRYVPRLTPLASDSDTVDGVSGWEEYIIIDAARKAALKEESFELADRLNADKAAMTRQIEAAADNRDPGEPQCVVDVTGSGSFGWPGGGPWY